MVVERNIRLINLYTICSYTLFFLPVIVPYYKEIGLTFQDFLLGEAVFAAVLFAAEIPSGWISDIWRRKTTLVCGLLFGSAGYFWLMFADTLFDAIISQGIIGIAVALNSGTVTAMLYDTLLMEGQESEYRRLEGKRHAIGLYAVAGSSVIGAFAYTIDPKLPLQMDLIVLAIGMVTIAMASEPVRAMKAPEKNFIRDMLSTMHYALRGHKEVAGIILVSMVIFSTSKLMLWTQQPYFELVGIPVEWFGVAMATGHIIGGIAGHWSHKLEPYGRDKAKLAVMAFSMGAACLILSVFPSIWLCIPLLLTGTLTYGMGKPMVENAINHRVGSERRATILSTSNLMVSVLFIPLSIIMGHVSETSGIQAGAGFLAVQIAILGGIGLWLWKPKDPVRS